MQCNPQELSWQAIQTIVGVKLPSNLLRFDEIGFHLIKTTVPSVIDLDSDVEIVETDHGDDQSDSSRTNCTDNGKSSDPGFKSQSSPSSHASEREASLSENEESWTRTGDAEQDEIKDSPTEREDQIHGEECESLMDNVMSIDDYLEVTLSTDSEPCHSCSRCEQVFPSDQLLSAHQCLPKSAEEKKYPCHMCTEKFTSHWEMRKHTNTHFPGMLDNKSSFCHLCKKDYTKTGFMNHLRKHTGERPFVCELCHKAFSQSSSLSIHMKFHLNVRKHACTMCEKKFVTKSELSRHMTVHTKQKSYYCGVCDKAFTRSDNMKKHEKTHG